jgi:hypothetical protein
VCSYTAICVFILLYICIFCHIFVLHTHIARLVLLRLTHLRTYVPSYCCIYVLILLYMYILFLLFLSFFIKYLAGLVLLDLTHFSLIGAQHRLQLALRATCNVSMRQHASAYVSIRQHTSAYVSIRQHPSASVSIP